MTVVHFITHPDVVIDPAVPVPDWPLSERGVARMRAALVGVGAGEWVAGVVAVHCSTERKAIDGAAILAAHLGLRFATHAALGENDRSATGFLPREEFEATADLFFAHPMQSIRGWERAVDAQARVVAAVDRVVALPRPEGDVAIVAHGGVGALLLCALLGEAISRGRDQPTTAAGGFRFAFDAETRIVRHGWQRIDG